MDHHTGSRFPAGFLWGAGTAAHQVEGGNCHNDWWLYEQEGRLPHKSGACCEHYHRFEDDFDLAVSMGHNCHRLSLEWSRIEPADNQWDLDAVRHYADVIRALRERGLEPLVTLFHFTLPAWLSARGGWECEESVQLFARFVGFVVDRLNGEVKFWLTINEPTVYVQQAYINGEWPPLRSRAWVSAGRAFKNLARAHAQAYQTIHARNPGAQVGFAHSALWIEPCNPRRWLDRISARIRDFLLNEWFFRLIGHRMRPVESNRRTLDFIGLNYYTRCCVRFGGRGPGVLLGSACHLDHHADPGPLSDVGWEVYPQGLARVLERFARLGLPILITENGIATRDDQLRCRFLLEHLRILASALEQGLQVLGYLHWSLIDNFEWNRGTSARFGLVAIDYSTQARIPHDSARLFSKICRDNGLQEGSPCPDRQF